MSNLVHGQQVVIRIQGAEGLVPATYTRSGRGDHQDGGFLFRSLGTLIGVYEDEAEVVSAL